MSGFTHIFFYIPVGMLLLFDSTFLPALSEIFQEQFMVNKNNIVLIGMPAVGKSTIGILLAKKTGYDFIDTDILIQSREKKTLVQLISDIGVEQFLELEQNYLLSLNCTKHVIATGGSAVYSAESMKHLAENGLMVYLEIGLGDLRKRLSALDSRGVIRAPGQDITSLYRERTPLYEKFADFKIKCGGLTPDRVLTEIIASLTPMMQIR